MAPWGANSHGCFPESLRVPPPQPKVDHQGHWDTAEAEALTWLSELWKFQLKTVLCAWDLPAVLSEPPETRGSPGWTVLRLVLISGSPPCRKKCGLRPLPRHFWKWSKKATGCWISGFSALCSYTSAESYYELSEGLFTAPWLLPGLHVAILLWWSWLSVGLWKSIIRATTLRISLVLGRKNWWLQDENDAIHKLHTLWIRSQQLGEGMVVCFLCSHQCPSDLLISYEQSMGLT